MLDLVRMLAVGDRPCSQTDKGLRGCYEDLQAGLSCSMLHVRLWLSTNVTTLPIWVAAAIWLRAFSLGF